MQETFFETLPLFRYSFFLFSAFIYFILAKRFDLALAYVYWQRGEVALADAQFQICIADANEKGGSMYVISSLYLEVGMSRYPIFLSLIVNLSAARLHYHFGGFKCM